MIDRVVLVSENQSLRSQVEMALQGPGCEVYVAEDHLEALFLLDRKPSDLMLLEVETGGIEGLSFCRVVRQSWDVGIILLLHRVARRHAAMGYQLGADAYLVLPFDQRELVARTQALARRVRFNRLQKEGRERQSGLPGVLHTANREG